MRRQQYGVCYTVEFRQLFRCHGSKEPHAMLNPGRLREHHEVIDRPALFISRLLLARQKHTGKKRPRKQRRSSTISPTPLNETRLPAYKKMTLESNPKRSRASRSVPTLLSILLNNEASTLERGGDQPFRSASVNFGENFERGRTLINMVVTHAKQQSLR